jgi:hypothetical protein
MFAFEVVTWLRVGVLWMLMLGGCDFENALTQDLAGWR